MKATNNLREYFKTLPATIARMIATLFYTVKYNWFYILLSVLAPVIIYEMGAGREIVALLFDPHALALNTLFLVLSLALMSATIWLVPSLSIYLITAYGKMTAIIPFPVKTDYFSHLITIYSFDRNNPINDRQNQISAKYLAMLPWTMVCSTLIQFSFKNEQLNSSITIFLTFNSIFISLMVVIDGIRSKIKESSYWFPTIFVLVCSISNFSWSVYRHQGFEFKEFQILVWAIYLTCMFMVFFLLTKGGLLYKRINSANLDEKGKYLKLNNWIHASLYLITFGALILLTYFALHVRLPIVSTLTVLILCLNFYMLIVDSLVTAQLILLIKLNQRITPKSDLKVLGYKLLIGIVIGLLVWGVFFNNTNNYKHKVPEIAYQRNDTLETYFDNWRSKKLSNMLDTLLPMNVYLISGQGGGSRAAVYMLSILYTIEKSQAKELYNQTFSISSISGSSAGIGQYIGQHENIKLRNFLAENSSNEGLEQLRIAYSYNFFNSNLLGLLFYDRIPICIKDIIYKPQGNTYASFNRNYVQEKEEQRQLKDFADRLIGKDTFKYSFFQNNIHDLYNKPDSLLYATPLVFFNTTVLNEGKKGIFSPVVNEELFGNNIDLLKKGVPVTFHFAEISSQSFPLLNNFSYFNGYFLGDGGIYENSGTSTTLKIYRALRKYCDKKNYKVRFILMNVLNGYEDTNKEKPSEVNTRSKSIFSLLVSVFSKMPFSGHENDATISLKQEVDLNNLYSDSTAIDYVFNIRPDEEYALSRVFSKNTLDSFVSEEKLMKAVDSFAINRKRWEQIDSIRKTQKDTVKEEITNEEKIYRLYTQYKNSSDKDAVKDLLKDPDIKKMIVRIPPIDMVTEIDYNNEIRYFHKEDSIKAENLSAALSKKSPIKFRTVFVTNEALRNKTPVGQLELWINTLK